MLFFLLRAAFSNYAEASPKTAEKMEEKQTLGGFKSLVRRHKVSVIRHPGGNQA